MTKLPLPFDLPAFESVQRAPQGEDEAKAALLLAAQYMRAGEPLPMGVAEWLAGAIEVAIRNPARLNPANTNGGNSARALAVALGRAANNRRPAHLKHGTGYDVGQFMAELIEQGKGQNKAAQRAIEEFNISESTAKRLYREYLAVLDEVEADRMANPGNYE